VVNKVKGPCLIAEDPRIPGPHVIPPADASPRDSILKIKKEPPDAKFSFDLSAGSKDMCLTLFALSLRVKGDAFCMFGERKKESSAAKLAVPITALENIAANPNYIKILQTLYPSPGKQERSPRVLPRSYNVIIAWKCIYHAFV
jgi:hypothetical protein